MSDLQMEVEFIISEFRVLVLCSNVGFSSELSLGTQNIYRCCDQIGSFESIAVYLFASNMYILLLWSSVEQSIA